MATFSQICIFLYFLVIALKKNKFCEQNNNKVSWSGTQKLNSYNSAQCMNTFSVLINQTSLLEQNKSAGFLPRIFWNDLKRKESALHPRSFCAREDMQLLLLQSVDSWFRKKWAGIAAYTIVLSAELVFGLWKGQHQCWLMLFSKQLSRYLLSKDRMY